MFRTFLAQVWYDKAVWEENKWNDEILHSFTAVLRINHLCNTPQAYLTRNLMKTLRIQLFFSAAGTSVLGSKTNTLLAWSWETRKRCVCFFFRWFTRGTNVQMCSKYKGDFKMVTLLQHLYNKRNKHIMLYYTNYTHQSIHILLVRLWWHVLPLGSTLKWSSRLVTNSSKLLPF